MTINNSFYRVHGFTSITPALSPLNSSSPTISLPISTRSIPAYSTSLPNNSTSKANSSSATLVSIFKPFHDRNASVLPISLGNALGDLDIGCPPSINASNHHLILPISISPPGFPLSGTNASDIIVGTSDQDIIDGMGGNDTIQGRESTDILCGGPGNDNLQGGTSPDILFGQSGNDTISGGFEDDYLNGGSGNDKMYGNEGDDILEGGSGADYFNCGDGYDVVLDFHPQQGDRMTADCETVIGG
jgi:hypothetical protein